MLISLIYAATAGALGCCLLSLVLEGSGEGARRQAWSDRLLGLGWVLCLLLFIWDWELAGAPPFGNMRHVLSFLPLAALLPLSIRAAAPGVRLQPWLAATCALALIGALCMPLQATWRQAPALQSLWFAPHVTSYVISYAWLTVAALLAATSYFRPQAAAAECETAERLVLMAFPLMSFGLGSGMLWADDAWGSYWSWDIKESWSLLTWCLYLIWFHLRRQAALPTRRALLLLGFAAVVITFLVVNLLPKIESLHSYAG